MVENTSHEYLDLEIVEAEIERWLVQHDIARGMFEALPPDQQDAIRRDGNPSIIPLAALVACKPDLRELGATILRRVLDNTRAVRLSPTPLVVGPCGTLSHPSGRMEILPSDETTDTENGARVERDWAAEVQRLEARVAEAERRADEAVAAVRSLETRLRIAAAAVTAGPMP